MTSQHSAPCRARAAVAVAQDARRHDVSLTARQLAEETTSWLAQDLFDCTCSR